MGRITDDAKATYASGPSSNPDEPNKADIIRLFTLIDTSMSSLIDGLVIGGAVVYSTRAALYADLAHGAGFLGVVYNDGTAAYNGVYVKSGSSGSGSWAITGLALPSTFAADLAAVVASNAGKLDSTLTALTTLIGTASGKTTPVDADAMPIRDSAASGALKLLTWANVKATLKTYFDSIYPRAAAAAKATPVDADIVGYFDSEASSVPKQATFANLKAFLKTYFDTLYQPVSALLSSIASVAADGKVLLKTGANTIAGYSVSSYVRDTIWNLTTGAAIRTEINAQPASSLLTAITAIAENGVGLVKTGASTIAGYPLSAFVRDTIWPAATGADIRTAINAQPLNGILTSISGLAANGIVLIKTATTTVTGYTISAYMRDTLWNIASGSAFRTEIGAASATDLTTLQTDTYHRQPRPTPGNITPTNAVRNVFAANGMTDPGGIQGGISPPYDTVTYPYLASPFAAFGHPNGIQIMHAANGILPVIAKMITPEELADIGLVPSDVTPPTISVRMAYQNTTRADQVRVALQYSDEPLTAAHSGVSWADKNVLFIDAATTPASGFLGDGDSLWTHTADSALGGVSSTIQSVRHLGIKVPATYGGKPFKGIKLLVVDTVGATLNDGSVRTLIAAGLTVIRGTTLNMWDAYINPVDEVRNFTQPEINEIERMASEAAASGGYREITVANVPRILVGNNSLAEAGYSLRKKFWGSIVSQRTDWNLENIARAGDDYVETFNRIVNDTSIFGGGARSMPGAYVIINDISNAGWKDREYQDYWVALRRCVEAIMSLGAVPILMSEPRYGSSLAPSTVLMGLSAIAKEYGIEFWNVSDHCRIMEQTRNTDYYYSNHGGTRTQRMVADFVARKIRALPRPSTGLKIYRRRGTQPIANLRFDTLEEKARVWEEINIGHTALTTITEENFDSLTSETVGTQAIASEYLDLKDGEPISIPGICMIEAILPGSARNISEVTIRPNVSGSVLTYYARKALRPLGWTPEPNGYQAIECATLPAVSPGDVYQDNEGQNFTIEGTDVLPDGTNVIVASPYVYGARSAQTFSKISGAGGSTASFTSTRARPGQSPEFYQSLGMPWSDWVAIPAVGGLITIDDPELLQECIIGDKISIAIVGTTTLTMLSPEVRYRGTGEKFFPPVPEPVYLIGSQKLDGTLVTDAEWTTVNASGTDLGAPTTAAPSDGWLPADATEVAVVSNSVRLRQPVALESDARRSKTAQIIVRARYAPDKVAPEDFGSSPITPDTVDVRRLVVLVNPGDTTKAMRFTRDVGLAWDDVLFDFEIPVTGNLSGSYRIEIYCEDGSLQVALVELVVA